MAWNLRAQREWRRIVATVLIVVAAALLRVAVLHSLGLRHPFLTFYPAVVIAALYGGLFYGFLASALSAWLANSFLIGPGGRFFIEDWLSLPVFVFEGVIVTCVVEVMRRARARAGEAEAHARLAEERQRSAEMLRESEVRLRLALESGQMGMWEWDVRSDFSTWNDQEYQLLGLPVGDGRVSTREFFQRLHPDDAAALDQALAELFKAGTDFSHEFRIVRRDGEIRWLAAKGRLYRDDAGLPLRMMGVNFDITSERLAEEELLRSEAQARAREKELEVLMDAVPAITFIAHDPQCLRMSCSRQTRQLLHLPAGGNVSLSAPEGERPANFHPMRDGKELSPEELPLQIAATGREVRDFEMVLQFDDGTSRDILGNAVPLFDEGGKARGAVGVFLDVTEHKVIERELQKTRDELERRVEERTAELQRTVEALKRETDERLQAMDALRERDQMLIQQGRLAAMGEMIGNIAHQWRQPLNTLGLLVQELPIMYQAGEFTLEYLNGKVDKAKEKIRHMSETIDDFRDFFRPNREKVWFSAKEVVAKTISLIEDSFKNLQIEIEIDTSDDPMIHGYPNECCQVFLNIFCNSRDAFLERNIEEPRAIAVRIFTEGGKTVVTIADNAGGIAEGSMEKIFDPYFTTKSPETGTGLGLFMSKAIIEKNMNGRIAVRNTSDGAEFRIEV